MIPESPAATLFFPRRTRAAALLGISRTGLAEKMERLGVGLKTVLR
jgi:hypothetical protein